MEGGGEEEGWRDGEWVDKRGIGDGNEGNDVRNEEYHKQTEIFAHVVKIMQRE